MPAPVWAIVVAGGDGRRYGRAKQFEMLGGRRVLDWAVETARSVADEVVLVLPAHLVEDESAHGGCSVVVAGGSTRSGSVRAGLHVIPRDVEVVAIHDAARPLASAALFSAVIDAVLDGAAGAVPGVAVADTIKRVDGTTVIETLDRAQLVAVQTPQAFRLDVLRQAHDGEPEATDDAALVEAAGFRVVVVPGEVHNAKLTESSDLERFEQTIATHRMPLEGSPRS